MSISEEQRSFAPRRQERRANGMKRDPLPDNPDNTALGRAIREVEECVHETGERLNATITRHRTSTDKRLATMNKRLAEMRKDHVAIREAIGLDDKGRVVRKTALTMGRFETIATMGGVVTVAVGAVQLAVHLWPAIVLGADALWRWISAG